MSKPEIPFLTELRREFQRAASAEAQGSASPRRSWQPRMGARRWPPIGQLISITIPVLAVAAVVAVILLNAHGTDRTAPAVGHADRATDNGGGKPAGGTTGRTSTTTGSSVSYPPSSIAAFDRILGVLRRAQTPADLGSPTPGYLRTVNRSLGLRPIRRDSRLATKTQTGIGVFLLPTRLTDAKFARAIRKVDGSTVLLIAAEGGSRPVTVDQIEAGQAYSSNTSNVENLYVVVPDGVARVAVTVLGRGGTRNRRLTATVRGNVATFRTAGRIAAPPRLMRWYGTSGEQIPISSRRVPMIG